MTTDELVALVSALTDHLELESVRRGEGSGRDLDALESEDWLLLVRFLAGERPPPPPPPALNPRGLRPDTVLHFPERRHLELVPIPPELEHEDEGPPRKFDMEGVTLL